MSAPRELELKLEVGPRQVAALKAKGLRQLGAEAARERLASVYFDTAEHALRKKGLSLRVRSVNGRHVQTIKESGDGAGIGLFDRSEWEAEVGDGTPDLAAAALTPVGEVRSVDGNFTIGNGGGGPLTADLKQQLTGIQRGTLADPYGWVQRVL